MHRLNGIEKLIKIRETMKCETKMELHVHEYKICKQINKAESNELILYSRQLLRKITLIKKKFGSSV